MPLQPLSAAHLSLILPWRNAPAVRRAMYSHHEISIEEHLAWFQHLQRDPSRQWFVYHDCTDTPQGVAYFQDIDTTHSAAFWGFYARPGAAAGTGLRILLDAVDTGFHRLRLHKLYGEVLADNAASLHLLNQAGFTEEGRFREQHNDGVNRIDIVRFGLMAREWPAHRDSLAKRVAQLAELPAPAKTCNILILSDATSWINPHTLDLQMEWQSQGHNVTCAHTLAQAESVSVPNEGINLCFCLSFSKLVPAPFRKRFDHTLVVHESGLPKGKGWSPLTWQIIEGCTRIPVSLIEAADEVDSGTVYAHRWLEFHGHELVDEMRIAQGQVTQELCRWFVDAYPASAANGRSQQGEESYYPRRRPEDSRLAAEKPLAAQFDLLRVVDNERYPAFFEWQGHRYTLTVHKQD